MMNTKPHALNRRRFAQLSLGGVVAAGLAACGGGSGGGSSINLREAFDKIQYRMTKDEVREIVGRQEDAAVITRWTEGNQELIVSFGTEGGAQLVSWQSGQTRLSRTLYLGE